MKSVRITSALLALAAMLAIPLVSNAETAISAPGPGQQTAVALSSYSNIIVRAYRDIFGRDPDAAGLAMFSQLMADGKDESWVRNTLQSIHETFAQRSESRRLTRQVCLLFPFLVATGIAVTWLARRPSPARAPALVAIASIGPILYFFWIWKYSVNVPSWDDFDAILSYINSDFPDRLSSLLKQHNEHRILVTRLVAELCNILAGCVNFKAMIVFGNAALIGIFALYCIVGVKHKLPLAYLPALSFILFAPTPWIHTMWAMAAIQNNFVLFLSFSALLLFLGSRGIARPTLSMVTATLAVFTSASGIMVFPALLITLVLGHDRQKDDSRRSFIRIAVVALYSAVVAASYFSGYTSTVHDLGAPPVAATPVNFLHYFLILLGGVFPGGIWVSTVGGAVIALLAATSVTRGDFKRSPVLFAMMLYLLLSAGAMAIGRFTFGLEQALEPRYRIISILLAVTLIEILLARSPQFANRAAVQTLILTIAILLFVQSTLAAQRPMRKQREILIAETANWITSRYGLHYPRGAMEKAGFIFDTAVEKKRYEVPSVVLEQIQATR